MRRSLLAALAALTLTAALLAGCTGSEDGTEPVDRTGQVALPAPLPPLELGGFAGGEPAQLDELRGPMVLNLWASWCGPCAKEMPVLEEFHQAYQGRVAVVGVDYQDPQTERAEQLVAETGVTYPLYTDVEGELDRLGPFPHLRGLPFLAFVDAEGRVVAWEFVVVKDLADLQAKVAEHLGVT